MPGLVIKIESLKNAVSVHALEIFISIKNYTIIDFSEVDIRIYLPVKVIIHRGR